MKKMLMTTLFFAVSAHSAPVFNFFELGIRQGQENTYDEVGRHNIESSVAQEPGTLAMYSVRHSEQENMAYMIEVYSDNESYQAHLQSPQYHEFLRRSPEILGEHKRKIELDAQFLGDKEIRQTPATINNLVVLGVKPEYAETFRALVLPEMAQSLKVEEGVWAMYAATEKNNPNRWYFYEIYADEAAYQAHRQTPHFQDYLTQSADMVEEKTFLPVRPLLLKNKGGLQFTATP